MARDAFVTPLALSCGNVYRSYAWPPGEKAVALAGVTFGVAAVLMLAVQGVLLAMAGAPISMPSLSDAVPIIIGQSFASGFGYFFFFRLQQAGGPVYLSQISYVNTTVGVVFAAILFSELIGAIDAARCFADLRRDRAGELGNRQRNRTTPTRN